MLLMGVIRDCSIRLRAQTVLALLLSWASNETLLSLSLSPCKMGLPVILILRSCQKDETR